jgi:antitoxin component of MazEF toxin-antitoxin module
MPTVKLHYDGWICLPASLCRALGLSSGDRLTAELLDGALALRPIVKRTAHDQQIETAASSATGPRETAPPEDAGFSAAELAPAALTKRRGRPRREAATLEPEPAPEPVMTRQPWILRKKAELPPAVPVMDKPAPRESRPEWRSNVGFAFVERRPFRQVEVRKLGPGRGHNRPQPVPARQRG